MFHLKTFIFLAGVFQIVIVVASLAIPKLLHWKEELSKVSNLIRHMFWTYAGYILVTNLAFGLTSVFLTQSLMDGSSLAAAVTFFIGLYWAARLAIQFFYFDRTHVPSGFIYRWGEVAFVACFLFLSSVYLYAFYFNINQ